jgi:hypothetical protein
MMIKVSGKASVQSLEYIEKVGNALGLVQP